MPQDWQKHLILSTQMAGQLCVVTPSHLEKNMILQSHFTKKGKKKPSVKYYLGGELFYYLTQSNSYN